LALEIILIIYEYILQRGIELLIVGKSCEFIEKKTMLGEIDCLEIELESGAMVLQMQGNYAPYYWCVGFSSGLMGALSVT